MKVVLDCASAQAALDTVAKITNADHANLDVVGKDIWMSAAGNGRNIRFLVKGEVEDKGEGFGFNVFVLRNILKGRKEVSLVHGKKGITFESKDKRSKLSGDFLGLPHEQIEVQVDEGSKDVEITGSTMNALQEAVKRVSLNAVFGSDPMTLFVVLDKTGLYTTIFDTYHLAWSHNSAITSKRETSFSLSMPLWDLISDVAAGQDYQLGVGQVYVTAKGLGFEMSVPVMQSAEEQTFNMAKTFVEAMDARIKKADKLEISIEELMQTLDNLSALNADGKSGVTIESIDGHAAFRLESSFGNVKETRRIKVGNWKNKHQINPSLLRDAIACYPSDTLTLMFTTDMVAFIDESKSARTVYSCLLIQQQ